MSQRSLVRGALTQTHQNTNKLLRVKLSDVLQNVCASCYFTLCICSCSCPPEASGPTRPAPIALVHFIAGRWWNAGKFTNTAHMLPPSIYMLKPIRQADSVFSGISTFGRLPYEPCLTKGNVHYDIAFLGTCLTPKEYWCMAYAACRSPI